MLAHVQGGYGTTLMAPVELGRTDLEAKTGKAKGSLRRAIEKSEHLNVNTFEVAPRAIYLVGVGVWPEIPLYLWMASWGPRRLVYIEN